jgi:GNAT superfamily N-acetyltransferase
MLAFILSDWSRRTAWLPEVHSPAELRVLAAMLIERMEVIVTGDPAQGFLARQDGTIHALYVLPALRGLGTGTRLLDQAKATSAELVLWCHQANAPARAFYARHGFAETGTGDGSGNDEGLPEVRLTWRRRISPEDPA